MISTGALSWRRVGSNHRQDLPAYLFYFTRLSCLGVQFELNSDLPAAGSPRPELARPCRPARSRSNRLRGLGCRWRGEGANVPEPAAAKVGPSAARLGAGGRRPRRCCGPRAARRATPPRIGTLAEQSAAANRIAPVRPNDRSRSGGGPGGERRALAELAPIAAVGLDTAMSRAGRRMRGRPGSRGGPAAPWPSWRRSPRSAWTPRWPRARGGRGRTPGRRAGAATRGGGVEHEVGA